MTRKIRNLVPCLIAAGMLAILGSAALAQDTECQGQGTATLLIKGSCEPGTPLKFKLAGTPRSPYRLMTSLGAGPTEIPGVGTFCLEVGPGFRTIARGRLSGNGFATLWDALPDDPALLGETIAYQFLTRDDSAPNGFGISNGYQFVMCAEGSGGAACDAGVRRLGYYTVVHYDGTFPVDISTSVSRANHPEDTLGEVALSFDPDNPPAFPISTPNGALSITSIEAYPGYVIVHSLAKGCVWANGRLYNESLFVTEVGDVYTERQIHTSCSVPIGPGSRFAPVFITYLQDVKNAPEGDCDG